MLPWFNDWRSIPQNIASLNLLVVLISINNEQETSKIAFMYIDIKVLSYHS